MHKKHQTYALLCLLVKLNLSLTNPMLFPQSVWIKNPGWFQRMRKSSQMQTISGLQQGPQIVCAMQVSS